MTQTVVLELTQRALWLLLQLSMPALLLSLVVGLAVSIFQAVTQINEMTLTFIPKIVTVFGALAFFGPWMLSITLDYMTQLLVNLPQFAK
ncbi:MAG: flagellar biosynthesis protein FliQ [Candidatus Sericytochromatia bacterium]|jgi:flagellar biosynthetic protein FliQ|nr:flagellar biosynthesis protein FliQ [Candidatus Sericytochromatia bacterium]